MKNKKHLLADFGVKDEVIITCTTLSFTNDNHRFYNYILGQSICFNVSNYPYYRKRHMGKKLEKMKSEKLLIRKKETAICKNNLSIGAVSLFILRYDQFPVIRRHQPVL